ncbi:hypothetical protein D3C74_454220 [compost metagenome]
MLKNSIISVVMLLFISVLFNALSSLVVNPAFLAQPLNDGENHYNQEQGPGYGGSIAHFVIAEGILVNEQG